MRHVSMPQTKYTTTQNYDDIREWILEHKGMPAIKDDVPNSSGTLTVAFGDDGNRVITWREFFDRFENDNLAFHYMPDAPKGEGWRSFNFINREFVEGERDDKTELPEENEMAKENMFPAEDENL